MGRGSFPRDWVVGSWQGQAAGWCRATFRSLRCSLLSPCSSAASGADSPSSAVELQLDGAGCSGQCAFLPTAQAWSGLCLVGCCTLSAWSSPGTGAGISPSAEQRPWNSLSATDGSSAWDKNGLTAVRRACMSHKGLSPSPALLPGCLPTSQQWAFQLGQKLLV